MYATPYADVNSLLCILRARIRHCLGENLTGLYLYGSLTTGDFDPGISDVDLLAATAHEISEAEFASLRRMHADIPQERPEWAGRIEVAYVSVAALQTFRTEQNKLAIISPGEPFHCKPMDKGYLLHWYVARMSGTALVGPPAAEVIPPITQEEYVRNVKDYVSWLAARLPAVTDPLYRSYTILTACRALYLHRVGGLVSKKEAAAWAQGELAQWSDLIENALALRRAWRDELLEHAVGPADTLRFVNVVKDHLHC